MHAFILLVPDPAIMSTKKFLAGVDSSRRDIWSGQMSVRPYAPGHDVDLLDTVRELDGKEFEEALLAEDVHGVVRHVMREGDGDVEEAAAADLQRHVVLVADETMAGDPFELHS